MFNLSKKRNVIFKSYEKILVSGILFLFSTLIFTEHQVIGTQTILQGEYKIISNFQVNDLQVLHVRQTNGSYCASSKQHDDHIEINGPINPDVPMLLLNILNEIDDSPNRCTYKNSDNWRPTTIYMNSGGGYMKDGYKLGEIFREHGVLTRIARYGGECYSSCATAFLGGDYRRMGLESKLMFHAPYRYTENWRGVDLVCLREDKKLLSYMRRMLSKVEGDFLYQRTMSFCSNVSGWSVNKDAAESFGILR